MGFYCSKGPYLRSSLFLKASKFWNIKHINYITYPFGFMKGQFCDYKLFFHLWNHFLI